MRRDPPHPLIRYRHWLLALAVTSWLVAGVTLVQLKESTALPVATIVGFAALVFIWANGVYWWIVFRYPYIDVGNGSFASHDEWKGRSHGGFLVGYFLLAVVASVGCLRVALDG